MKAFEYASARSLKEAVSLLREKAGKARVLAGGTDLVPQMKERIAEPERLVDLQGVPGLNRIDSGGGELRLGALVSLAEIAEHPEIASVWRALSQGAGAAASPQIRNAGTLGGNLCQRPRCWYYRSEDFLCRKKGGDTCFALEGENKYHAIFGGDECRIVHPSDTAPALVAFGSTAAIQSPSGERRLPLAEFFAMPSADVTRENVLRDDEILSAIQVPKPSAGTRSAYLKIREKASFDFALVSCAAVLTFAGPTCERARIVLGGVAPVPWRCPEAEEILAGQALDPARLARCAEAALAGAAPLSKNRYKVALAKAAVRRVLDGLRET
jgi:xanthine dehydrogenase YagS FAD-binding subunit